MPSEIDLSKLTEDELAELNHEVVTRLKMLRQMRRYEQMAAFKPGDRVSFESELRGCMVSGVVIRCNQKSVTLHADTGEQWRVTPGLLMKTVDAATSPAANPMLLRPGPLFERR